MRILVREVDVSENFIFNINGVKTNLFEGLRCIVYIYVVMVFLSIFCRAALRCPVPYFMAVPALCVAGWAIVAAVIMCGSAIWTGIATCVGGGVMTGFAGRSDSAIWTGVVTCIGGGVLAGYVGRGGSYFR